MKRYTRRAQCKKEATGRRTSEEEETKAMQRGEENQGRSTLAHHRATNEDETVIQLGEEETGEAPQPRRSSHGLVSSTVMDEKRRVQRGRTHTTRSPTRTKHQRDAPSRNEEVDEEQGTTIMDEKRHVQRGRTHTKPPARTRHQECEAPLVEEVDEEHGVTHHQTIMDEKRHVQRGPTHTARSLARTKHQEAEQVNEERGTIIRETIMGEKRHARRGRTHTRPSTKTRHQEGFTPLGEELDDERGGTAILHEKQRIANLRQHTKRRVLPKAKDALDRDGEPLDSGEGVGAERSFMSDKLRIARKGDERSVLLPKRQDTSTRTYHLILSEPESFEEQTELPTSQSHITVPHETEPGAIRVGLEREGTVQILSDQPVEPITDRSDDLLVHAHVVDDTDEDHQVFATAKPDPWWRRHQWWLAGGAVVLVGAIVVASVLTTVEFGTNDTSSPSIAPSSYSDGIELQTARLIESKLPDDVARLLADTSSSQYSALQWVVERKLENVEEYSDLMVLQLYSLAVLYSSTQGQLSWMRNDGWLSSIPVCDWYGVRCTPVDGGEDVVTGLNLTSNGLIGAVSSDLLVLGAQLKLLDLSENDLSGTVPEDFGEMTSLTHLSLGENNLASPIPVSFGSLTNLKHLDLSANSFESTLPTEIGRLTLLEELFLDDNELLGEVPSELGLLTNLEHASVSENRLSFVLPSELGRLGRLKTLDVHGNAILGPLPTDLGRLRSLHRLFLNGNYIFNTIPSELGSLSRLTSVDLSDNLFTGELPVIVSPFNQLTSLRVSGNFLEGNFPRGLAAFYPQLVELDLSSNFFTNTETILQFPSDYLWHPNLQSLNIASNRLEGVLLLHESVDVPKSSLTLLNISSNGFSDWANKSSIELLPNLTALDVSGNRGLWPLPNQIRLLSNLVSLDASSTRQVSEASHDPARRELVSLHASETRPLLPPSHFDDDVGQRDLCLPLLPNSNIPCFLWSMTGLESVDLGDNYLLGTGIPTKIAACTNLREFRISNNRLLGSIPTEIGQLTNLESFQVDHNSLYGSIPSEVGLLSSLQNFHLHWNNINGSLTSEIGSMARMTACELSGNSLHGPIPSEVGLLSALQKLLLSRNFISGSIPSEIGLLAELTSVRAEQNNITGSLPSEIGTMTSMTACLLEENRLHGSIPSEIGLLSALQRLSLSENTIGGSVPSEIGNLAELRFLSVDNNRLTGSLPSEIGRLANLDHFDCSQNHISGNFPKEIVKPDFVNVLNTNITGSIPQELCEQLLPLGDDIDTGIVVDCGNVECSCCRCPTPSPTEQPSETGTPTTKSTIPIPTSPPTPPPLSCPAVHGGGCSICGANRCITEPDAVFAFPGQPPTPCAVLEAAGYGAVLPLGECAVLRVFVDTVCGCHDSTETRGL